MIFINKEEARLRKILKGPRYIDNWPTIPLLVISILSICPPIYAVIWRFENRWDAFITRRWMREVHND